MDRKLTATRDRVDTNDYIYKPRPIHLPKKLLSFERMRLPVLDQGKEGACTGFALAAAYHYCLRKRRIRTRVSPWHLYYLAKKHDEWVGEDYSGSSCRGALKGAAKFGACKESLYRKMSNEDPTFEQELDGLDRVLGAYYRVNGRKKHHMLSALVEYGVLFCSADVHSGWNDPIGGRIVKSNRKMGGHAFAVLGYDSRGFWAQNSWGKDYGAGGFCNISFEDWEENGGDAWIPVLGV